jgi:predicted 2-oxoglutarate/Fe(II)-dependent dioxygenase YbiX
MLLLYTADDSSVHSVEAVTSGERCTLTMWFTLLPEHQEDTKVCVLTAGVGCRVLGCLCNYCVGL